MSLLRRLLPAPILSIALLSIWIVLVRGAGIGQLLLGSILAVVVPVALARLRLVTHVKRPGVVVRYVAAVALDVVKSNFAIARDVVRWGSQRPASRFVVIPLELRDPAALAVLAMVTTIVPGTVWCELALDRSAMLLHAWHVDDEHAFVTRFKSRYEQPLREIFE